MHIDMETVPAPVGMRRRACTDMRMNTRVGMNTAELTKEKDGEHPADACRSAGESRQHKCRTNVRVCHRDRIARRARHDLSPAELGVTAVPFCPPFTTESVVLPGGIIFRQGMPSFAVHEQGK